MNSYWTRIDSGCVVSQRAQIVYAPDDNAWWILWREKVKNTKAKCLKKAMEIVQNKYKADKWDPYDFGK